MSQEQASSLNYVSNLATIIKIPIAYKLCIWLEIYKYIFQVHAYRKKGGLNQACKKREEKEFDIIGDKHQARSFHKDDIYVTELIVLLGEEKCAPKDLR